MIDANETFYKGQGYENLSDFIIALDFLVRVNSGPVNNECIEELEKNREKFSKEVTDLVMEAVRDTLHINTTDPESPYYRQSGLFPKYKGEPSLTHYMWQLRYSKTEASD